MAITITGVPETISRADYLRLIESVGIDPNNCMELTFGFDCITAKVRALDENGKPFATGAELAVHHLYIRVEDED